MSNRSDHIPNVIAFESWTLLELHLHQPSDFPTLIDSQKLTSDPSLGIRHVFDSLKGLQPLTQDIAKKLFATGVLMFFGPEKTSVLRSAAGVIPRVVRTSKPIQAQGRLRANKVRNFLCRQHGVKKKRFKRGKLGKRLSSAKIQKRERLRDGSVSAVTSLAKIPENTSKNSNCKKSTFSRQRKLTLRKSEKSASSIGQIDRLFQLQLRENSDIQKNDLGQHENIEDISDEDFIEECPDPRHRLAGSESLDKGICQPDSNNNDTLLDKEGLCGTAGNVTPRDRIGDDPIEDFSDEKQPGPWKPSDHENLMTSPAKRKRNTDRTARNLTSGQVDDAPTQTRAEQHAPDEHEQGTTDLILEGLMSGNSKKQKSLLDESVGDAHPVENGKQNEGSNAPVLSRSSERLPNNVEDAFDRVCHCCSYAAVPPSNASPAKGIQGQYGIISLFDGVSSVVRILKQKLQQPPTAIILAELDEKIRGLVCAEFGYRSDEQWGYTSDGSTCCYIRDVNTILKDNCFLLRQVVCMYPNLKWFIVGGSPCQDLTFAGPSQGLLGLVGSQSRLFFVLLCTIRTMQVLVGTEAVRFLVENAGSMKPVHYVAFCRLLGLPHKPPDQYIWDLAKHTPFISRKRNFFRNFPDVEPVQNIPNFLDQGSGPLLDQKGLIIAFAPLLRTREVHQFGVCHSSWTLYQPHALVWDCSFWGDKEAFSSACRLVTGKVPSLCWDRLIPPPFLDNWKKFLRLLQKKGAHAKDFDPLIGPLLPMFSCKTYKLPMRLLKESEIMNHWTNTSSLDAEKLPEALIRDMCGNSFHPALISSALGSNETIRHWVDGVKHDSHVLVAGQHQALSTYTELCGLIQTEIAKDKKNKKKPQVVNDLPHYPTVEKSGPVNGLPMVAPAMISGIRIPEITKQDQHKEHGIEAALLELDQKTCMLFNRYGIGDYFDAFRACVRTPFTFDDYCRITIGDSFAKHSVPSFYAQLPNRPVAKHLQRLQEAFVEWDREPVMNSLLTLLLNAVTLKKQLVMGNWALGPHPKR